MVVKQTDQEFEFNKQYKNYPGYREAYNEWSSAHSEAHRLDRLDDQIIRLQDDITRLQAELTEANAKLTKPLDEYARKWISWRDNQYEYKNDKAQKVHRLQTSLTAHEEWLDQALSEFDNLTVLTEQNNRRLHNAALQLELEEQVTQKKIEVNQAKQAAKVERDQAKEQQLLDLNANPITIPARASALFYRELLAPTSPHPLTTITPPNQDNAVGVMVDLCTLRDLLKLLPDTDTVSFALETNQVHQTYGYKQMNNHYPHLVLTVTYNEGRGRARFVPAKSNGYYGSVAIILGSHHEQGY